MKLRRARHSIGGTFISALVSLTVTAVFALAATAANPVVKDFLVNDGDGQRSKVTSLSVQFDQDVSVGLFSAGAWALVNLSSNSPVAFTDAVGAYDTNAQRATWTFPGLAGGSLADGYYQLTLYASSVTNSGGEALDGNGDGAGPDNYTNYFHRYFGDANSDRDVDFSDLFWFRQAYLKQAGQAGFDPAFDHGSDGVVDTNDFALFDEHYLTMLPLPGTNATNVIIFQAIADAAPRSGNAPLTVTFRDRGIYTGGSIIRYRWDYQGDGTWDVSNVVAADRAYTFTTPGTYVAVLEIQNNLGETTQSAVTIVVGRAPPTVSADADPSNGQIPLTVNFTATASSSVGTIVLYEWDFDGNGVFDYSSATSGSASYTYASSGTFMATCRVTDDAGLTATARTITTTIRPGPPGSPTVRASANQTSGNAPLTVNFGGSSAGGSNAVVAWEWDFDGDGTYDISSPSTASTTFVYTNAGVFAATLRATDSAGLTGIDSVEITVNLRATLSISDDTFEPGAGETGSISTSLNAPAPVRILLKDRNGSVIRTLVSENRVAGNYTDAWDGRDDTGRLLPEGAYYAILEYVVGGETRQIDLTATTGGSRYNPSRSTLPSRFYPFNDNMLTITFTVPGNRGASEVTAFIGLFNVDTRFLTLTERQPFGVGTHTLVWDGVDAMGQFATPPPGDQFLFGIWGYTLPDNAIYLQSAPVLSNVSVDPNYFDPSTPDYLTPADPTAVVTYSLSEAANVELTVTSLATASTLRRIEQLNVPAGTNQVVRWNGRADNGIFVDNGDYRLTLRATDSTGSTSLARYSLVRVYY
ncbi:MAG TPA: PKD domain-containing protein [Candidatus Paceibacterota bacterium]|nr:PKD domain-containing protein [Verrucomicrobiota bacterium]HRZ44438.1 PKD domain-containing protein [Candidatus Paceibacterota bacterium]